MFAKPFSAESRCVAAWRCARHHKDGQEQKR
jgi:hypothetical protein